MGTISTSMQLLHWLPRFFHRHKSIDFLCKAGLQEKISEINFNNGSRAIVDLSDPEPRNVFIQHEFEPHFFEIANALMPKDATFFDLGANVGFCTFGLVPDRPTSSYHLFEANPHLIKLLEQSIDLHPDQEFTLNHVCVSDSTGKTRFHLEPNQSGQSHVSTKLDSGIEIQNLLLDEYCDNKGTDSVDFAKIDLEGHELPALQGWRKCLSEHRVKAIYIEIMPENQARYGRSANAPLAYLESHGYELYLCKEEDFEVFGNSPHETSLEQGSLLLSRFRAEEYPGNFATDALALAPA
jgi:FkbM family methyltransferase